MKPIAVAKGDTDKIKLEDLKVGEAAEIEPRAGVKRLVMRVGPTDEFAWSSFNMVPVVFLKDGMVDIFPSKTYCTPMRIESPAVLTEGRES